MSTRVPPARTGAVLAAGLVLSLVAPLSPVQAAAGPGPTLRLVTGDSVTLDADSRRLARFRPGPGRSDIGHTARWERGRLLVVPADAAPAVAAGRVDRALFDVTALVQQGYHRRELSVLVERDPRAGAQRQTDVLLQRAARRTRILPGAAAEVYALDPARPGVFWRAWTATRTGRLWLNAIARLPVAGRRPPGATTADRVGPPAAGTRPGGPRAGQGVRVAVLDSGIKRDHPDLRGTVALSRDFTGTRRDGGDDLGHGTHVAGIIAGSGTASNGRYRGVAPGVRLVNAKVCDGEGNCATDAILAGMEWAATQTGARVVNMSLGLAPSDGGDPVSRTLDRLSARTGALFTVAAGNSGEDQAVVAPAVADAALAVGSVTEDGRLSGFSTRGPRQGDRAVKPEVAAVGSGVVSTRAESTPAGDFPSSEPGDGPVDAWYTRMSGTSMAAPQVAGVAAVLAAAHPGWRAPRLKAALMSSAVPVAGVSGAGQGAGVVRLERVLAQTVTATTGSLAVVSRWPGRRTLSRTVAFHNAGREPVELALDVRLVDGFGEPVETAAVRSRGPLRVTPGGSARTTVEFRSEELPTGQYSGWLTASGAGQRVSVPFTLYAESG